VGETDYNRVKEEYGHQGLEGDIIPFIHDMAGAYNSADIVVSRAGATTIAELAFLGKPSILIPYPYSANRHQELNARMLHRVGGAEMILQKNLDGQGLADLLMKYMSDRTALNKMGAMAQGVGRPNAVQIIVDQLTEMIKRN
jgi:UDP-N-acetylglucosamine--N-acetylmuramyl-(pentapeptide) pyrophosphoryl-undecaprenol N-acetylglucosamine transferase